MKAVESSSYLEIDGSLGEGGGQILRTAVSLSAITGRPVQVASIRANRPNPGLRPQHLTAIQILAKLFDAKTENLKADSDWIRFRPSGKFNGGPAKIDVGTAGSIPLILLTLVPAVALSRNELQIEITGGTDVKSSPTIDYVRYVITEAYRSVGVRFSIDILRRGYYPKGGGIVRVEIEPCRQVETLNIAVARNFEPRIASVCCQLPRHVAERQISSALIALEKKGLPCRNYSASLETAHSPGSSIVVYAASDFGPFVGGDSIGEIGKRAETVGADAATRFLESVEAGVPVDPLLADMIVLPLALAKGRSKYRTSRVTRHLATNLQVASQIIGCRHTISAQQDGTHIVELES